MKHRAPHLARRRLLVAGLAALFARGATAQAMITEVIPIGFRRAEELLPIIRPLVPPPGSVGGIYNQLVVRTTPANMAEIRQVLASLDRAPANLLVSVRHTVNAAVRRDLLEASGSLSSGDVSVFAGANSGGNRGGVIILGGDGANQGRARVLQTESREDTRDVQSVRVLEGHEAFIRAGQSVPLGERRITVTGTGTLSVQEGVRYEDIDSGFYVIARLAGDIVTVDVSPRRRQRAKSGGGVIDVQSASTVVSGPLGRWMEIGGVDTAETTRSGGITSSTRSARNRAQSIFIKVDRLP